MAGGPYPPFIKGGNLVKSLRTLPPFVKGDRGGFRRAKRLLHGIESPEMVTQQTPHITYLSTYGVSPRLPLPWLGSIQTKNADFITLRNTIVYRISLPNSPWYCIHRLQSHATEQRK